MSRYDAQRVEVSVEFVRRTDRAILVKDGGDEELWLPLSQVEDFAEDAKPGDALDISLPEWLAKEKGLI